MPFRKISGVRFEELVAVKQFYAAYLMGIPQTKKLAQSGANLQSGYIPKANMTKMMTIFTMIF